MNYAVRLSTGAQGDLSLGNVVNSFGAVASGETGYALSGHGKVPRGQVSNDDVLGCGWRPEV